MPLKILLDQGWSSSYTVLLTLTAQVHALIPYIAEHKCRYFLCFLHSCNKMLFRMKESPQLTLFFYTSTI